MYVHECVKDRVYVYECVCMCVYTVFLVMLRPYVITYSTVDSM